MMMKYEQLLDEAFRQNIHVIENANFSSSSDGLINNDVIGINKNIRTHSKRACILAEELGHYYTSTGNILDPNNINNRKQEHIARMWAYDKLIGLKGIISAFESGCKNTYETAQFLDVTEEFLIEAIDAYKSRYGIFARLDNYAIYFIPSLGVMKLI